MNTVPAQGVATLIWTREGAPIVISGRVTAADGKTVRFEHEAATAPTEGERCVLWLENEARDKLSARVLSSEGGKVLLTAAATQTQRRYYPRIDTPASFVFRVLDTGPAASSLSKRQLSVMKKWSRPVAQEMNLSVDGLAFLSVLAIPAGARVQVKLRLPDDPDRDHVLVGDVIRSALETLPDGEEYHRLAVHLADLPPDTHRALVDYTAHFQDRVLDEMERR